MRWAVSTIYSYIQFILPSLLALLNIVTLHKIFGNLDTLNVTQEEEKKAEAKKKIKIIFWGCRNSTMSHRSVDGLFTHPCTLIWLTKLANEKRRARKKIYLGLLHLDMSLFVYKLHIYTLCTVQHIFVYIPLHSSTFYIITNLCLVDNMW